MTARQGQTYVKTLTKRVGKTFIVMVITPTTDFVAYKANLLVQSNFSDLFFYSTAALERPQ